MIKKIIVIMLILTIVIFILEGCSSKDEVLKTQQPPAKSQPQKEQKDIKEGNDKLPPPPRFPE